MPTRLTILNGPNLNLLGIREPHIYGTTTLAEIEAACRDCATLLDVTLAFHQSNHEGQIVDLIQAARTEADAIIINPAALSFTSISIIDALKVFDGPIIELHISNIHTRDELHRHSKTSTAATAVICGLGPYGYIAAMLAAVQRLGKLPDTLPASLRWDVFDDWKLRTPREAPMKTSIATVSLSGTLGEKIEAIAAARFDAVEIFENDLVTFSGTPADVRDACRELGLEIVTLQPFRDFEGMPPGQRERVFARAERKFDVMQELGCDLLMICSNVSPDSLGGIDRAAADLRELGERAARRGLRIAFEALAWGRHINDYRDSWEAVRRADHPAVGLVLDSFHILARGTDLSTIRSIPGDRIFLVQLADAPLLQMDYLSWSRHFRNFPGQGDLPVLDFMKALQATSYDGALSLEIFNDQFRAGSARSVAVDGHRSLRFMLDQLGAGPVALPPRQKVGGVSFIEFSADEHDAPLLEGLLAGLGFRRAGQHRSKAVTRWCQGGINLVVNREKEGFAHSFNLVHGSAVCALGLDVADAAATFQRATLLLDAPFNQPVAPGELDIPAVRGVGGSLLYFLDQTSTLGRVWDIEFEPTGESAANETGLTTVDHISQSMQYEEMLSWLLFYTSLLEVEKVPVQEVADPGGLIRSQVIEAADGSVRFVLNASQSPRTQSSRFLSELFGSGVQHIAFATDDLPATVERLERNGVRLLAIPANYYDDLEAKTDLPAGQIEAMRARNILYDREGGAEYFQVYTETFDQRFFFEIVQRRGYRGYGASNAPVRLAAQARLSAGAP